MDFISINMDDKKFISTLKKFVKSPILGLKDKHGNIIMAVEFPPICYIVEKQTFETFLEEMDFNYYKPDINEISKKIRNPQFDIISFIKKSEKVRPSNITMGFVTLMRDNIISQLIAQKGKKVLFNQPAIFLCPENIYLYAKEVEKISKRNYKKRIMPTIIKLIFHHELGHWMNMSIGHIPDIRVSEAIANYFAFGSASNNTEKYIFDKVVSLDGNSYHHYHHVLNHLEEMPMIYNEIFNGNITEGIKLFYKFIGNQPMQEVDGGTRLHTATIGGFPCFGSEKILLLCSGSIGLITNVKSGIICCSKIRILDGFFSKDVIIWTNDLELCQEWNEPRHCKVIDKRILDFSKIITTDLDREDLKKQILKEIPPEKIKVKRITREQFYVCIPCSLCQCYTRTNKLIDNPDKNQIINIINEKCEFCKRQISYHGDLIVSYSKNGYHMNRENQEITKYIEKTFELLKNK